MVTYSGENMAFQSSPKKFTLYIGRLKTENFCNKDSCLILFDVFCLFVCFSKFILIDPKLGITSRTQGTTVPQITLEKKDGLFQPFSHCRNSMLALTTHIGEYVFGVLSVLSYN